MLIKIVVIYNIYFTWMITSILKFQGQALQCYHVTNAHWI